MRYYSTQRPVGPGTFPKLPENKVLEVHNFDAKTFCEEIGRGILILSRLLPRSRPTTMN